MAEEKRPEADTEAEVTRTRNSNVMLLLTITQSIVTVLIALRTFGFI